MLSWYKKWKIDRIISILTLLTTVICVYLVIKRPQPVAIPQSRATVAANAQSFAQKFDQIDKPRDPDATPSQVHITGDEVSAAFAEAAGQIPAATTQLAPDTDLGAMPEILDKQVSFDGDQVHGQFLVKLAGKDVWLTVSGHLNSKEGYVTFDPTEFKVGDMSIPVSLVNGPLQKRLAEQRSQLKLPDNVGDVKIENGELVLIQK
jgi:uncharacterized protein YpmS